MPAPSRRRGAALALALSLSLAPGGCRAVGRTAADAYAGGASTFTPNPVSVGPFFVGFGLGFIAALPLCLISWPLTLLLYPEEDEGEFELSASLSPGIFLGLGVGCPLAAVFYPFGIPWLPDDPEPPPVEERAGTD